MRYPDYNRMDAEVMRAVVSRLRWLKYLDAEKTQLDENMAVLLGRILPKVEGVSMRNCPMRRSEEPTEFGHELLEDEGGAAAGVHLGLISDSKVTYNICIRSTVLRLHCQLFLLVRILFMGSFRSAPAPVESDAPLEKHKPLQFDKTFFGVANEPDLKLEHISSIPATVLRVQFA